MSHTMLPFRGFHCDFPVINANMSIMGFHESIKFHSVLLNLRVVWGTYPVTVNAI